MNRELAALCRQFRRFKGRTIVGLTGTAASGKSSALAAFRALGAFCLSSDEIAKEVLTSGPCYNRILRSFSPRVFLKNGSIDRSKLAEIVFSDKSKRKRLEKILHPEIIKRILSSIQRSHDKLVIVEVPLLFETGLEPCFDVTVCVSAGEDVRMGRAAKRGWKKAELKARSAAQLPARDKAARADIVLENNGTMQDLKKEVKGLFGFLNNSGWRQNDRKQQRQ